MNLIMALTMKALQGIPRVSGGEPPQQFIQQIMGKYSPRERG